jgi:hypothetical protein
MIRASGETYSSVLQPFTVADMERFALEAWGPFGRRIVEQWCDFNARYFGGALRPVPLVLHHTQPFGKRIAFCSYAPADPDTLRPQGRTITLNVPSRHKRLLADNDTLLHEMIHQYLFERGEAAGHDSAGWRREIMRLNREITGQDIWAGRSKTGRRDGKVVRFNEPGPAAQASLTQGEIARWPHDHFGIDLGPLGT